LALGVVDAGVKDDPESEDPGSWVLVEAVGRGLQEDGADGSGSGAAGILVNEATAGVAGGAGSEVAGAGGTDSSASRRRLVEALAATTYEEDGIRVTEPAGWASAGGGATALAESDGTAGAATAATD
jgi:hypothetical protein